MKNAKQIKIKGVKIRNHHNFSWGIIIIALLLCMTLCMVVGFGYQHIYGNKTENISNGDQFVSAIKENSNSANAKVQYNLVGPITLKKEHLDIIYSVQNQTFEEGAWFYGSMDGHGYTVTIESDVTKPLFERICSGASIKGINFTCKKIVATNGADELALLTKENYGDIRNISIIGDEENSGYTILDFSNAIPFAASIVCVRNYGDIFQCAVKSRIESPSVYCKGLIKLNAGIKWNCYFGAVSAYCLGNGNIHGAVVSIKFDDDFTPLQLRKYNENGDKNDNIGYFFGYSSDYSQIDSEAAFYVIGGEFIDNATDYCHLMQKNAKNYPSEKAVPLWDGWEMKNYLRVKPY